MKDNNTCCNSNNKKSKGWLQGLIYGTIPHIGCIAFIIASIFGVTVLMQFFKPILMNRYFFHALIGISLLFATLSSTLYLRKNNQLSLNGIKQRWKYITGMYASTIGINLIFFMIIFPLLANVSIGTPTGAAVADIEELSSMSISVDIPCPGHAPLITNELKTIEGVIDIEFSFPNDFNIQYDSTKTTKEEMLSLDIFNTYLATVLSEDLFEIEQPAAGTCGINGGEGCGSSTCGGSSGCGCSG